VVKNILLFQQKNWWLVAMTLSTELQYWFIDVMARQYFIAGR
jgi:hypothetical protein